MIGCSCSCSCSASASGAAFDRLAGMFGSFDGCDCESLVLKTRLITLADDFREKVGRSLGYSLLFWCLWLWLFYNFVCIIFPLTHIVCVPVCQCVYLVKFCLPHADFIGPMLPARHLCEVGNLKSEGFSPLSSISLACSKIKANTHTKTEWERERGKVCQSESWPIKVWQGSARLDTKHLKRHFSRGLPCFLSPSKTHIESLEIRKFVNLKIRETGTGAK